MSTGWSLDFCLVCDRQTSGGPYCSQSCRLSELDQTHPSTNETLLDSNIETQSSRGLSTSASQTSLDSLRSDTSETTLSDELQGELRSYASSFDPVRDLKRRLTTS